MSVWSKGFTSLSGAAGYISGQPDKIEENEDILQEEEESDGEDCDDTDEIEDD